MCRPKINGKRSTEFRSLPIVQIDDKSLCGRHPLKIPGSKTRSWLMLINAIEDERKYTTLNLLYEISPDLGRQRNSALGRRGNFS
jgi:hypothetical protein